MPVPCDRCPLRRRDYFLPFTEDELSFMLRFPPFAKDDSVRAHRGCHAPDSGPGISGDVPARP